MHRAHGGTKNARPAEHVADQTLARVLGGDLASFYERFRAKTPLARRVMRAAQGSSPRRLLAPKQPE
jgi:hypothetical protein